ncbi:MAG: flagellar basal body L-ring protein FlgH [Gammaproteobacteria bacterium]|nr:flagellar basal body L-ring protein FlgH [Gammaproteobacteria bacterium]
MKILFIIVSMLLTACAANKPQPVSPDFVPVRPIISTPPPIENGGIYQNGYGVSFFSDVSAKRVGDIITVVLSENTNARKSASTNTGKDSQIDMATPTLLGGPVSAAGINFLANSLDASRSFSGSGDSSQSNSLNGRITVTVSDVLPNGHLIVQGEKRMSLNQGNEHIRFSGIVRPADIRSDNTVVSTSVANAQIIYGGTGMLAQANTQGWFTQFLSSEWWPF